MVSTRGPRYKFSEGEKVLCYEPDPTKAKVLYDSKVLEVIKTKDKRGRPIIEYLIHFQGWNSSWDRCVGEDFVLKDTEENRQLQRSLAEKSQLQIGAYLYRRERKKTTTSTSTNSSITNEKNTKRGLEGDCSSSSCDPEEKEEEDDLNSETSSHSESSSTTVEDKKPKLIHNNPPPIRGPMIRIGPLLIEHLTMDSDMMSQGRFIKLPIRPNVLEILEGCVRQHSAKEVTAVFKPRRSRGATTQQPKEVQVQLMNKLNILQEVADGIRVYFDYCLSGHLLYKEEMGHYKETVAKKIIKEVRGISQFKQEEQNGTHVNVKTEAESPDESGNQSSSPMMDESQIKIEPQTSARRLRSHKLSQASETSEESGPSMSTEAASNSIAMSPSPIDVMSLATDIDSDVAEAIQRALSWQIVPDNLPPYPAFVYGATHLARLFVKFPEFLTAINMAQMKLNLIIKNIEIFVDYLEEHEEWFVESIYSEANPGPS